MCVTSKSIKDDVKAGTQCYKDISKKSICKFTIDPGLKILYSEISNCDEETSDSE